MSNPRDAAYWHSRAAQVTPLSQLLIDGRMQPAEAGGSFECLSPIDGRTLAQVAAGESADVDAAVRAARAAFERGTWSQQSPAARKRVLLKFAELIEANLPQNPKTPKPQNPTSSNY